MINHKPRPIDPMLGMHPIITNVQDACHHLQIAVESQAGYNKDRLRHEIANVEHWLSFLRLKVQ